MTRKTPRRNAPARMLLATLAIGVGATTLAPTASADWDSFWFNLRKGFHRNNAWPQPYVEADVRSTIAPFEVMKHNGWQLHNTISHDLFREGDGVLLASGNERVRWIANHAPEARRQIHVMAGSTQKETDARLASVRESVASLEVDGRRPEVLVTRRATGWSSGAVAVKVNRTWLDALPIPQLPQTSASGNAGVTTASGARQD